MFQLDYTPNIEILKELFTTGIMLQTRQKNDTHLTQNVYMI